MGPQLLVLCGISALWTAVGLVFFQMLRMTCLGEGSISAVLRKCSKFVLKCSSVKLEMTVCMSIPDFCFISFCFGIKQEKSMLCES